MSVDILSAAVHELLEKRIESFDQLEILLFLYRRKDQSWTAHDIAKHLRQPGQMTEALDALCRADLVEAALETSELRYAYSSSSSPLDEAVSELSRQYRDHPLAVMRIMSANSIRRVRTKAAHTFTEALVLRRAKDSDRD